MIAARPSKDHLISRRFITLANTATIDGNPINMGVYGFIIFYAANVAAQPLRPIVHGAYGLQLAAAAAVGSVLLFMRR